MSNNDSTHDIAPWSMHLFASLPIIILTHYRSFIRILENSPGGDKFVQDELNVYISYHDGLYSQTP